MAVGAGLVTVSAGLVVVSAGLVVVSTGLVVVSAGLVVVWVTLLTDQGIQLPHRSGQTGKGLAERIRTMLQNA